MPPLRQGGGGGGDSLALARSWEASREYALAIDGFLNVTAEAAGGDPATLAAAWLSAVRLAADHDRSRHADIAETVAERLVGLGRWEAAGDLFRQLEVADRAAECYMRGAVWTKAREAARGASGRVREQVEAAYRSHAVASGDAESMVAVGAVDAALASYAASRNYEKLFESAAKAGSSVLARYIFPYVEERVAAGRPAEAVAALAKYGAPVSPAQVPLLRKLAGALFGGSASSPAAGEATMHDARDVLYKAVAALRKGADAAGGGSAVSDLEPALLLVHYASSRLRYQGMGLTEVAARLSLALLRFAGTGSGLPAERGYYEAGSACKAVGWRSHAFVLYNRFLDIANAIDDGGDLTGLDNVDFVGTGLPSPDQLADEPAHYVGDAQKEEARDWVLAVSMDSRVDQSLPTRPCFSCGSKIFDAALGCSSCRATFPACIVTGFPIPASQMATCPTCSSKALKSAWNAVVGKTKTCPWCAAPANQAF